MSPAGAHTAGIQYSIYRDINGILVDAEFRPRYWTRISNLTTGSLGFWKRRESNIICCYYGSFSRVAKHIGFKARFEENA